MNSGHRAQASVEYLVILAVVIIVCLAVFAFMAKFKEGEGSVRLVAPYCGNEAFGLSISGVIVNGDGGGSKVALKAVRDLRIEWVEWDGVRSESIPDAGVSLNAGSSVTAEFPSCSAGLLHAAYSLRNEEENNGSRVYIERFNLSSRCGGS